MRKGDTLYSIALDFGQDYRDVAAWNNLANASYIQIGQRLRVSAPASSEHAAIAGPLALPPATLAGSNEKPDTTRPVPTFEDPVAYR
ncbi:MAG TPA: LysM domain-containing protein, partial [Burkholderiales bacterium]|nr:LysM domain-containing protein [Burkholderiales bacterium]